MKSFWNKFIQILGVAGQVATIATPFIPDSFKIYVVGSLAIGQAIAGMVAHNYNPDGTPASTPYYPPIK